MKAFENFLLSVPNVKVIDSGNSDVKYILLDLSATNTEIQNIPDALAFENHIEEYLSANHAKVAYGGYNEKRTLYKRSELFDDAAFEKRDIHIGMDLWIKAGTAVLAAVDGKIHSFANNTGIGNYGPTIILKHQFENHIFYTLYGHLSVESLQQLEIGQTFRQGEIIGTLGDHTVNGDYAPHLHFQIIKNIEGYFGDYPGVCALRNLEYYLENCPDPNLLLKVNTH